MTNQEIIAVVQAAEAGNTIQHRSTGGGDWFNGVPLWNFISFEYRIKPEPREFYATEYPPIGPVGGRLYGSYEAVQELSRSGAKIIKLREVLES